MVVVSAPSVDNICESFTHNLLTWVQGNPIFLSLTGTHKECIYNESKFESDFGGGQHVCACVVMGDQQYYLHSHIKFVPPRKPGLSPTYPPNPTHGYIAVTDRQHKKKPPQLPPSQKHEQIPQENFRRSHLRPADPGGEIYGDRVCKQVFCRTDGLDLR